jgi:hypothetical protein
MSIVTKIIDFPLVAVVFIVILLLLFPSFKKAYAFIQDSLGNMFGLLQEQSKIEKAILCAYYRCSEGVVSENTDKYCSEVYEGEPYAPPIEFNDSEGKVCNWNSFQYPVEINIQDPKGDGKISNNSFEGIISCIITDKSKVKMYGNVIMDLSNLQNGFVDLDNLATTLESTGNNYVFVNNTNALTKEYNEECKSGALGETEIEKTVKEIDLSNKRYISIVESQICSNMGITECLEYEPSGKYVIAIFDQPTYVLLKEKNVYKKGTFYKDDYTRIRVEPLETDYSIKLIDLGSDYVHIRLKVGPSIERGCIINPNQKCCLSLEGSVGSLKFNWDKVNVEDGNATLNIAYSEERCTRSR